MGYEKRGAGGGNRAPIVAGAIALIRQRRVLAGQDLNVASIRKELLSNGFRHISAPTNEVGTGRLNVAGL